MRALIATVILALADAPLRAADVRALVPGPPEAGAARANAPVSLDAPSPVALAAQEDHLLGPPPAAPAGSSPEGPPAGRSAWGVGAGEIVRVVTALAAVLGLLLGARLFMRRVGGALRGGGRPGGVMNVLGRYPLARGQHLLLLRLGAGRIILLHQTRSEVSTLSEVTDPDEVARLVARIEAGALRPAAAGRFQALLGRLAAEDDARQALEAGPGRARSGGDIEGSEVVDLTRRGRRLWGGRAPA